METFSERVCEKHYGYIYRVDTTSLILLIPIDLYWAEDYLSFPSDSLVLRTFQSSKTQVIKLSNQKH